MVQEQIYLPVKTLAHGTNINSKYRIGISDVKRAADVAGSDYGSFSLQVIVNNPGQNDDGTVLENFSNLSFDEESTNYLPRVIGDRFITIDSDGKLTTNGDYPNQSKYIRVADVDNLPNISKELVPMGFGALSLPHAVSLGTPSGKCGTLLHSQQRHLLKQIKKIVVEHLTKMYTMD